MSDLKTSMKPKYIVNGVGYALMKHLCAALDVPASTAKYRLESPNFTGWAYAKGVVPRKNSKRKEQPSLTVLGREIHRSVFEMLYRWSTDVERQTIGRSRYLFMYDGQLYCSLYAAAKARDIPIPRLRAMFTNPRCSVAMLVKNPLRTMGYLGSPVCRIHGKDYWRHLDACVEEGITYGVLKHRLVSTAHPSYQMLSSGS